MAQPAEHNTGARDSILIGALAVVLLVALMWVMGYAVLQPRPQSQLSIHQAASEGELAAVKRAVERGESVNGRDQKNRTPLLCAIRHEQVEVVEYLLQCGADPNAPSISHHDTPLHQAARRGSATITRMLLEAGADANARNTSENTPLYVAAFLGHAKVAELLLQAGAEVNAACFMGFTPLYMAARLGRKEVVQVLVDHGAKTHNIHEAAGIGDVEKVRQFLAADDSLIDQEAMTGGMPLHWAAVNGELEVVRTLIEAGADVNASDTDGETPLTKAARDDHGEIINLLLAHGATVNTGDQQH